jgi:glyoxylase-like metal-dependent hydrolase (beta-lactamase superfamily II)
VSPAPTARVDRIKALLLCDGLRRGESGVRGKSGGPFDPGCRLVQPYHGGRRPGEVVFVTIDVTEAASGVFLVIGPRTNWCLIREGDAVTLVDAAWPKDYPLVVESLSEINASPAQVEAVVLTHAHPDHVGVAERFRADHGAPVHAHRDEEGHAKGLYEQHARVVDLITRIWRPSVAAFLWNAIRRGVQRPAPVAEVVGFVDAPLDVPGGLVPVPTPGHTSGHCAFHLPTHGVVITGDALVNENILTDHPGPRLMPRIFSHDWQQAATSLHRLAPLDVDLILPGHGTTMAMGISDAVDQARQRLADAGWWDR